MKLSEIIKELQKELDKDGDKHIRHFKIVNLQHCSERNLLSPTRKKKDGYSANMNQKEFVHYCKENPI